MEQKEKMSLVEYTDIYGKICENTDLISADLFDEYGVKRGLRDKNGNGVLSGLTHISKIEAFKKVDGQKIPCNGKLWYRGFHPSRSVYSSAAQLAQGQRNHRLWMEFPPSD